MSPFAGLAVEIFGHGLELPLLIEGGLNVVHLVLDLAPREPHVSADRPYRRLAPYCFLGDQLGLGHGFGTRPETAILAAHPDPPEVVLLAIESVDLVLRLLVGDVAAFDLANQATLLALNPSFGAVDVLVARLVWVPHDSIEIPIGGPVGFLLVGVFSLPLSLGLIFLGLGWLLCEPLIDLASSPREDDLAVRVEDVPLASLSRWSVRFARRVARLAELVVGALAVVVKHPGPDRVVRRGLEIVDRFVEARDRFLGLLDGLASAFPCESLGGLFGLAVGSVSVKALGIVDPFLHCLESVGSVVDVDPDRLVALLPLGDVDILVAWVLEGLLDLGLEFLPVVLDGLPSRLGLALVSVELALEFLESRLLPLKYGPASRSAGSHVIDRRLDPLDPLLELRGLLIDLGDLVRVGCQSARDLGVRWGVVDVAVLVPCLL